MKKRIIAHLKNVEGLDITEDQIMDVGTYDTEIAVLVNRGRLGIPKFIITFDELDAAGVVEAEAKKVDDLKATLVKPAPPKRKPARKRTAKK